MTVLALGVERVLIRAIKKGSAEAAPRTAADPDEPPVATPSRDAREAQVSTVRPAP
jgi:hypothetical protein